MAVFLYHSGMAFFILFIVNFSYANLCDPQAFTNNYIEAMKKKRSDDVTVRTSWQFDPRTRNWSEVAVTDAEDISQSLRMLKSAQLSGKSGLQEQKFVAGAYYRAAEQNARNGNYLVAEQYYLKSAESLRSVIGTKKLGPAARSANYPDRELSDAIYSYAFAGRPSKAADMVSPQGTQDFIKWIDDYGFADQQTLRKISQAPKEQQLSYYQQAYHLRRLQLELYNKQGGFKNDTGLINVQNQLKQLQSKMESLARGL